MVPSRHRPDHASLIFTLGRFELVLDGAPLRFKGRAPMRALELLSALIAAGGRGVSVASLSDSLWPEADGFDAYRAFTTTLHRLRRLLRCQEAVRLCAARLTLDPQLCRVDLWEFERALRAARDQQEMRVTRWTCTTARSSAMTRAHGPSRCGPVSRSRCRARDQDSAARR